MRRFLVIEPTCALPEWMAKLIGRYLPPAVRWDGELCGVSGRCIAIADRMSTRGQARMIALIRQAQAEGNVCAIRGADRQLVEAIERATDKPIVTGELLTMVVRLEAVLRKIRYDLTRILLCRADTPLGQAVTAYLATKVRFLAITGERDEILTGLANRLWRKQGIAVTVGEREADIVLSMDRLCRKMERVTVGEVILPTALVEAAYLARTQEDSADRLTHQKIEGLIQFIRKYEVHAIRENAEAQRN